MIVSLIFSGYLFGVTSGLSSPRIIPWLLFCEFIRLCFSFTRAICSLYVYLAAAFSPRSVLCALGNMMDCQLYQDVLSDLTLNICSNVHDTLLIT